MTDRVWQIGLVGTFDVENYGDLLFPLLAKAELTRRLGAIQVHPFSYHARTMPSWPYDVKSLTELPQLAASLDAILIGGGFLIRFDKEVAPGYDAPGSIHHPTAYWLTPALIGLQHGVPIAWNAPGLHCNKVPGWAAPLIELVIEHSAYFAVRDEASRETLEPFTCRGKISVVPDTGFGIGRLLDHEPTAAFLNLLKIAGINKPYIIIQAALGLESFLTFVGNHAGKLKDFQFLVLPIGPIMGDKAEILAADLPGCVCLAGWPPPLLMAELISRAEAVVGHSYHLAITALTHGVPVFTPQNLSIGKYSALMRFKTIYPMPTQDTCDSAAQDFTSRIGRQEPEDGVCVVFKQVSGHWDRIAELVRAGPINTQPAISRFWQSLPALLERPAVSHSDRIDELQNQLLLSAAQSNKLLGTARVEIEDLRNQVNQFQNSTSWKLTSPLRLLKRKIRAPRPQEIMDVRQIAMQRMNREPYAWAIIDNLFAPPTAEALSRSFPFDHFKPVSGYGGEKDYEYEVRALIGMGATRVSLAGALEEPWFSLAHQFLSATYREALSKLIGLDLSQALLEVNAFHYGPRALLGPHCDLPDKIVTHVLYFNESWQQEDGGCLTILKSAAPSDVVAKVVPVVGNSAVLVRSENSWHAVSPVASRVHQSRRSLTATFYQPRSVSSLWPKNDRTRLHRFGRKEQ